MNRNLEVMRTILKKTPPLGLKVIHRKARHGSVQDTRCVVAGGCLEGLGTAHVEGVIKPLRF